MIPTSTDIHCAPLSLAQNSSLAGTATVVETWFLLEYNGSWTAKATDDNHLPEVVQGWLKGLLEQVPHSRVQFIKHPTAPTVGGLAFYTATGGKLYQQQVAQYADLLSLSWTELTAPAHVCEEQLYLVCTNGKRDWCCGKFGAAAFRHLDPLIRQHPAPIAEKAWMTTHLGGHRFAATLLFLPAGVSYGLVQPDELEPLLQSHRRGELVLERFRGRNAYPKPVQAAEALLYEKTGETRLDVFTFRQAQKQEPNTWQVQFYQPGNGLLHTVNVTEQTTPEPVLVSCTPPKWDVETVYLT